MTNEEAINRLKNTAWLGSNRDRKETEQAVELAIEALKNRPQGEWKIDEYGIYHCPICHAINNTVYKSFCPNCGADMRGDDE